MAEPTPPERLRHRAARAFGWVAAMKVWERVLGVVRIVVLARLLAPDDFGAFGIALLTMATLERLTRPGLFTAIIQKKQAVDGYLDAAWSALLVRAWLLGAALYLLRDPVADFFETPEAAPLIGIVALATVIGGFTSVGLVMLQRDLKLQQRFQAVAAASVADLVVAVPAAFVLRDATALAYGAVARNMVLVVASYLVHPYRPRFTLAWRPLLDLRDFAVHGAYQSWLFFVVEQGDDAFVGKLFGDAALGVYLVTYRVASILTQEVARVLADVTLPMFSRVQDETEHMVQGVREAIGLTASAVLPAAVLLALIADPFILLFLGPQWTEGVAVFRILLAFGLLRALSQALEAALTARGEVRFLTSVLAVQLAIAAAGVVALGLRYGLPGVGAGIAISQAASFAMSLRRVSTELATPYGHLLGACRGPILGATFAGGGLAAMSALAGRIALAPWLTVVGASILFGAVYLPLLLPRLQRDAPNGTELIAAQLRRFRR